MPGFTVSSVGGAPPIAEGDYPNFIQFRFNGMNLGDPTVTVVDFVGADFTVTRGTGDEADKITITIGV